MVVISEVQMLSIGVMHERVGSPLTCTVQAPQSAIPQPNFVPVRPRTSRNTHRSGVSPSTSTLCVFPLTLIAKAIVLSFSLACGLLARSAGRAHHSKLGGVDNSFGKGLGAFLGQVVPDTARDSAMFVWAGEFLRVGARIRVRGAVRISLERNGGHGNYRQFGKPLV